MFVKGNDNAQKRVVPVLSHIMSKHHNMSAILTVIIYRYDMFFFHIDMLMVTITGAYAC